MSFRYNSPLAPAPAPVSSPPPPQQQQQQQQQQWSGADSSASGTPNDPASLDGKRQRVSRACDRCRQKKVKCDGKRPVCTHCEAISATCTYLDATKKRGPPKGYIEVIENRLHKVEELLCALVESDPKTAKYIVDNLRSADGSKAAVVSDTNGKLFGMYTMDELESKAAMPAAQQPPRLSSAANADTETQPTARFTSTAPARDALASSPLMDDDIYPDESLLPAPLFTSRSKQSESPRLGGMPLDACNAEEREGISTPDEDDEHIENLTKLEKRVGHLTLDQSGSLRYLGNSSGWYIINRSLISSEATPRLSRGVEGAIRWPPISTIPGRDAESGNESLGTAAPAAQTTSPSTRGGPANGSYEALAFAAAAVTAQKTARARPKDGSQNQQSINVSVPRNLPPCGKPPMPDDDEKTRLLTLYFRYVHPGFPILYKSHFLKTALSKDNTQSPALMSAVYAAASTYKAREATNETELAKVRIEMVVHFQRAKLYLDEQYTLNTTATILTLLLMSVYEQGTMSTRSWLYSGMAVRKAYDMGLHRDVGAAKNNLTSVVSDTEAEIRQRAWWGCYIMDIMVSATLGRPTTIRDFTFDAPYPTNYGEDDDELWLESSIPSAPVGSDGGSASKSGQWPPYSNQQGHQKTSQQQQQKDNGSNKSSSHTGQDPKSSVPVAERMREYVALTIGDSDSDDSDEIAHPKTKKRVPLSQKRRAPGEYYLDLLHIFGHILTEMYTCKPHRSFAAQFCLHDVLSRSERLIALDHELRRWKASLPSYLQYSVDDILMVRPARCVYIALIHLVYHTALILLHRPFISKLGEQNNGGSGGGGGNNPASPMAADEHHHGAGSDLGSPGGSVSSGGSARTGTTTSPLPSHSICTLSAQMISLIGQAIIQDSRIFIMPFLTFMMFTAGTMHLNNVIVAADSWLARRFLKRTLEVMSRIGAHWQVSYKCYTMLNTLVRANRIGLEQVIDDPEAGIRVIKERSSEVAKIAHWVYENRSLYRNQVASSKMGTAQTSSSPRFRQSISSRQGSFGPGTSRLSSMSVSRGRMDSTASAGTDAEGNRGYFTDLPDRRTTDRRRASLTGPPPSSSLPYGSMADAETCTSNQSNVPLSAAAACGSSTRQNTGAELDMDVDATQQPRELSGMRKWPSTGNLGSISATTNSDSHSQEPISNYQQQQQQQQQLFFKDSTSSNSTKDLFGYSPGVHYSSVATTSAAQSVKSNSTPTNTQPTTGYKIQALRNSLDKDGKPIVPASPYTSVNLAVPGVMNSASLGGNTSGEQLLLNRPGGGVGGGLHRSAVSSSLGQFVPSLEFFANAEFPLGIGGPNGQASMVLQQTMSTHGRKQTNNNAGARSNMLASGSLYNVANDNNGGSCFNLSFSGSNSNANGSLAFLAFDNAVKNPGDMSIVPPINNTATSMVNGLSSLPLTSAPTSVTEVASLSAGAAAAAAAVAVGSSSGSFASNVTSTTTTNMHIINNTNGGITSIAAPVSTVTPLNCYSSSSMPGLPINPETDNKTTIPMGGTATGYTNIGASITGPNNSNIDFGGMLIDDDVIRNLPFSGPVSFDLNLGSMGDVNSMLAAALQQPMVSLQHQQQYQQQVQNLVGMDRNNRLNSGSSFSGNAQLTGSNGGAVNDGINNQASTALSSLSMDIGTNESGSGDTPWKDYVSQVIRMFSENYQSGANNDRSD